MSDPFHSPSTRGWYPDPSGRHERRLWDGSSWTAQVSNAGIVGNDAPGDAPLRPPGTPTWSAAPPAASPPWSAPLAASRPAPGAVAMAPPPPPPPGAAWAPQTPVYAPNPFAPQVQLTSLGRRFGAHLLDGVLCLFTLFIGWLIWSCFTYSRGQTPAKSLLGIRVVKQQTGFAASWGDMFVRNLIIQGGLSLLSIFLFGIPTIVAAVMIFSGTLHQTGWDRIAGTVVVDDPAGATLAQGR